MKKTFKYILLTAFLTCAISFQAFAADLASYKEMGLIGEKVNGLVGAVVASSDHAVEAMVDTINAERLVKYQAIAAENGLPLSKVQALAGQKLINQTPGGQYIQTAAGLWVRK